MKKSGLIMVLMLLGVLVAGCVKEKTPEITTTTTVEVGVTTTTVQALEEIPAEGAELGAEEFTSCLLYTSPSPRD